jgi:SAM-dependent methyltransferase
VRSYSRAYFEEIYDGDPDPWHFESSWYERRKYDVTVASLPAPRYHSAFEPGCSVGVLSALLADRCDRLLCTDIVPAALARATERLGEAPNVRLEQRAIPEEWPDEQFDLVVLSEIAYYFDRRSLLGIVERILATTTPGATVVAVHWRGRTDYPLSGDEAHRLIGADPDLDRTAHHVEDEFALDVWERSG